MKIVSESTLDAFRSALYCEWCGDRLRGKAHPHHVATKGIGGGGRIDHPLNIVSLCAFCHNEHHNGHRPLTCDLIATIAAREGVLQDDVTGFVRDIRRLPRDTPLEEALKLVPKRKS